MNKQIVIFVNGRAYTSVPMSENEAHIEAAKAQNALPGHEVLIMDQESEPATTQPNGEELYNRVQNAMYVQFGNDICVTDWDKLEEAERGVWKMVAASLKADDVTTQPKGHLNNLDVLPPILLKGLVDFFIEVDKTIKNESEARERMRTMSFEELFRAFCSWHGYAANTSSLAYNALRIYKCVHDNSNS